MKFDKWGSLNTFHKSKCIYVIFSLPLNSSGTCLLENVVALEEIFGSSVFVDFETLLDFSGNSIAPNAIKCTE